LTVNGYFRQKSPFMKKVTILLALVVSLGSCKKDDDNNPVTPAVNSTLTSGNWKLASSTSVIEYPAPIGPQTANLYDMMQACQKDNLSKFNTDKTVTMDEGATKCNASDPQTQTAGTWNLTNNDTKFDFAYQGTTINADVLTLNSTTFTIRYVTVASGITSTTTTSYTRP
jgi:hypothetical protein